MTKYEWVELAHSIYNNINSAEALQDGGHVLMVNEAEILHDVVNIHAGKGLH